MKKKKWTWWKILLIIVFSPFAVLYFGGKYLFKFYKSDRFTTKQKAVYTVIGVCVLAFISVIVDMNKGPELKKVEIADITLYKGKSQKVKMTLTPKDSNAMDTSFTGYDSNIISIEDNKIKGKNAGETTVVCEVTDDHSNVIKSNKFKVTVNLTEEQIAENQKKAKEAAAKAEQEAQEKRNTISMSESIQVRDYCKKIINSVLKSPSTAEYPDSFLNPLNDWQVYKNNNLVTVKSYVDAQNSFGAMLRNNFIIQVQMQDDGSGNATYVQLGDEVISGTFQ